MIYERITMIQIDYFIAVARHLNFTKAAKSLYVSQPSLSKQVASLEAEIGIQLFFRTKRKVQLTSAGATLFEELSNVKQQLRASFEKVRQSDFYGNGSIKIGCLESMDTDVFLPAMIRKFKSYYSDVDVFLERHSFKMLREKLLNGSLDIIFTLSFEIDTNMEIDFKTVYRTTSSIFMVASHSFAHHETLDLKDLRYENFIAIDRDESPRGFDSFIDLCRRNDFCPIIAKQLPNPESILLCVKAGLGIAILDSNIRVHNKNYYKTFKLHDDAMSIIMACKKDNQNKAALFFTDQLLQNEKESVLSLSG